MGQVALVIQLLGLIAELYPKISPAVKDLLEMFKGTPVVDITQEEFEARIDAAIAKLPVWE